MTGKGVYAFFRKRFIVFFIISSIIKNRSLVCRRHVDPTICRLLPFQIFNRSCAYIKLAKSKCTYQHMLFTLISVLIICMKNLQSWNMLIWKIISNGDAWIWFLIGNAVRGPIAISHILKVAFSRFSTLDLA